MYDPMHDNSILNRLKKNAPIAYPQSPSRREVHQPFYITAQILAKHPPTVRASPYTLSGAPVRTALFRSE
jgi:hypothetical protein